MSKLPPVTFHALDLSGRFNGAQEMADAFAKGSVGLEPREKDALGASVISALFHWPDYCFSVERHLPYPDRCARLLYAALYARRGVNWRPDALEYMDDLIEKLEEGLDDKEYDLFEGAVQTSHLRTEKSRRSHLRTAMCVSDIGKMVNGLFERDPDWVEPEIPFWTLVRRKPERRRKRFLKSFEFLGAAQ